MMAISGPKAFSVTETGELDGWTIQTGFECQTAHDGSIRLLVSVPSEKLAEVHTALLKILGEPQGFLYRQFVNRANPGPNDGPPMDFVALDLAPDTVLSALQNAKSLIYHDARCELWIRGAMGDQVILDRDGLLYCYPDDPAFRDVLDELGVAEGKVEVLLERDYVKHCFYAENDEVERSLVADLGLTQIGA